MQLRTRRKPLPSQSQYPSRKHMLRSISDFIFYCLQQVHTSRTFSPFITSNFGEHVLTNHCRIGTSVYIQRQDHIMMNLNLMLLPSILEGGRSRKRLFTKFSVFSGFLLRQHHTLLGLQYRSSYRLRKSIWLASRASRFQALHHQLRTTTLSFHHEKSPCPSLSTSRLDPPLPCLGLQHSKFTCFRTVDNFVDSPPELTCRLRQPRPPQPQPSYLSQPPYLPDTTLLPSPALLSLQSSSPHHSSCRALASQLGSAHTTLSLSSPFP